MNLAFNNSSSIPQVQNCAASETDSTTLKIIKTCLYSIIMVAALLGNLFIIIIVYKKKALRRTTNIFIANMAVSDLLIAMVAIPTILVELYIGPRVWLIDGSFGTFLCKFCFSFTDWSVCISIISHAVIAFDRFWAIVYSLRPSPITPARRKYIIGLIWLYGFILHSPNWYVYQLDQGIGDKTLCIPNWATLEGQISSKIFFTIIFIFVICIPVLLMIILYTCLMVSLSIHSSQLAAQASEVRKQRRQEDVRVLRKVLVMLTVFLLSVIPLTVLGILSFYVWDGGLPCKAWSYSFTAFVLFISNSALNPWLCIGLHESYRHYIRRYVLSWRYRRSVTTPSSSTKMHEIALNTQTQKYETDNDNEALTVFLQTTSSNFLGVMKTTNTNSLENCKAV